MTETPTPTPWRHGGKRPGSGRKPNTPNKATAQRIERAQASGKLPPDAMLMIARNFEALAARYARDRIEDGVKIDNPAWNEEKYCGYMRDALDAYNKCAPYFASKMATIHHIHRHMNLGALSDDELTTLERLVARAAEPGSDQDREGPTLN